MKIPVVLPIEVGKTYYTGRGSKVRIYATDGWDEFPIHGAVLRNQWEIDAWRRDGKAFSEHPSASDIKYEEWTPEDKELVWCWNSENEFGRQLRFWDAKNNKAFKKIDGMRDGVDWRYYAPFEEEWPDWAKEAQKKLED